MNVHPGTAAQDALRVNAPRRDPAVIQKEKDAVKERKALKVQEKEANQARNEATKCIADEFRAQQASKQVNDEEVIPRKTSKGKCQYRTFHSLTYILVTKKIPTNVSVSGNAKTSFSQPRATGLADTGTTGKKRKIEPQVGVSTPIQEAEQAPPPPKKKKKASVEPPKPSATTTATEMNHKSKRMELDNGAKKRPTSYGSDDASVSAGLTHPAKKAKVDEQAALTRVPIRRSGKIILISDVKRRLLTKSSLETVIFQVGSEIVTHKPGADGNSHIEDVDDENDNERTPRQKYVKQSIISEKPYETPLILQTKPWAPSVAQVDDTDAEDSDSEIERVVITKRTKVTRVSSGVQETMMIDGFVPC